jgi:hypothetical protein
MLGVLAGEDQIGWRATLPQLRESAAGHQQLAAPARQCWGTPILDALKSLPSLLAPPHRLGCMLVQPRNHA